MTSRVRVLHVVESFGGGVADAVRSFVHATPEYEHHLLYALRDGITVDEELYAPFASAERMPDGHLGRVGAVRRARRRTDARIVHAHSSFAGVYARMAVRRRSVPLVYSPHCFAFERRDLGGPALRAFRAVEIALAPNTTVFATCSDRETVLAGALSRGPVRTVVNVARELTAPERSGAPEPVTTIAMSGRLAPQKGVAAFAALAAALHQRRLPVRLVWIGGGDEGFAPLLREAGVEVTGWLPPDDVVAGLAAADLYVHTAEWEGFPIGVLEAISLGLPSLILERPYTEGLDPELLVADDDLALRVEQLVADPAARERLRERGAAELAEHTVERQREQLLEVYAIAQSA